ncbi:uncharacterized protein ACIBXB_019047 isoform 4-T7 [Morphnus guianensis]
MSPSLALCTMCEIRCVFLAVLLPLSCPRIQEWSQHTEQIGKIPAMPPGPLLLEVGCCLDKHDGDIAESLQSMNLSRSLGGWDSAGWLSAT